MQDIPVFSFGQNDVPVICIGDIHGRKKASKETLTLTQAPTLTLTLTLTLTPLPILTHKGRLCGCVGVGVLDLWFDKHVERKGKKRKKKKEKKKEEKK